MSPLSIGQQATSRRANVTDTGISGYWRFLNLARMLDETKAKVTMCETNVCPRTRPDLLFGSCWVIQRLREHRIHGCCSLQIDGCPLEGIIIFPFQHVTCFLMNIVRYQEYVPVLCICCKMWSGWIFQFLLLLPRAFFCALAGPHFGCLHILVAV